MHDYTTLAPPPSPLRSPYYQLGAGVFVTAVKVSEECRPRGFYLDAQDRAVQVAVAPYSGGRMKLSPFPIAIWILGGNNTQTDAKKCHEYIQHAVCGPALSSTTSPVARQSRSRGRSCPFGFPTARLRRTIKDRSTGSHGLDLRAGRVGRKP